MSLERPAPRAAARTLSSPTSSRSLTATVFFESARALRSVMGPSNSSFSKFCGFHAFPVQGSVMTSGESSTRVTGVYLPVSIAAAYRNGLKDEPGCRFACVARLKDDSAMS